MKLNRYNCGLLFLVALCLNACKDFLDVKPDQSLSIPRTLRDLQLMLDNVFYLNTNLPGIGEEYTDNFLLSDANWASLPEQYRQHYCFDHQSTRENQWSGPYQTVFYANAVLDGLKDIDQSSDGLLDRRHIEGAALFFRAHAYYHLVQVFAKHYDPVRSDTDLGIVLRRSSAIEEDLSRATVTETYKAILSDLNRACRLLPSSVPVATRPSLAAGYALLGRVHLLMGNYVIANNYADSALRLHNTLIDYNTLDQHANISFSSLNPEVLFHSRMSTMSMTPARAIIHPNLLTLYHEGDLRKTLFYRPNSDGTFRFKGGYDGATGSIFFNGISTAELYLIKAESLARTDQTDEALETLNLLLELRWETGSYIQLTTTNTPDVLNAILIERRKEMPFRGLRWYDLRRLSAEGRINTPLIRHVNSTAYILESAEIPYIAFKLPDIAMEQGDYQQN